jgi:glycolate oxidase FAD binding subunit
MSDTAFADDVGTTGPVAAVGNRTRWDLGGELAEGTRLVAAPAGIVEYTPEEMTVRVRAGTAVAALDAALAERGQRCALPDRGGTVGGAVAAGENHLCALGRGRLRDSVLQVRYVSAEGQLVTGGGPTVKNVTGFDLPRLMVGSLGTLGLFVEVILRTNPVPAESRWLVAPDADSRRVLDLVLAPSAVLWDGSSTWVLLEGHGPDVDAEAAALREAGSFAPADGPPAFPAHRWSLPPAGLFALDPRESEFVAALGLGLAFRAAPQPPRPADPGVVAVEERLKHQFDPTGRLAPGRSPGVR